VLVPLAKDQVAAPATEIHISAAVPYILNCMFNDDGYTLSSVLVHRVIQQFLITIGDCSSSGSLPLQRYQYMVIFLLCVCGKLSLFFCE